MLVKKKQVWKLRNVKPSTGSTFYLTAEMNAEDFDRVTSKNKETIVLDIDDQEIFFLNTPVCPIIIYRKEPRNEVQELIF